METLKPVLASVGDWIKYSHSSWIVWTDKSVDQIYAIIKPKLGPNDQFLVAPIDLSQKQGWMAQWIWDWIEGKLRAGPFNIPQVQQNPLLGPQLPNYPPPPIKRR